MCVTKLAWLGHEGGRHNFWCEKKHLDFESSGF